MSVTTVTEVRGFNRFYTRILGLLDPKLAGSAFGLTEARVLFELAHSEQLAVADLRRTLDLDAGYLSRILSRFIADGLVEREPSATDGRQKLVRLTGQGTRLSPKPTPCRPMRSTASWHRWTRASARSSSRR